MGTTYNHLFIIVFSVVLSGLQVFADACPPGAITADKLALAGIHFSGDNICAEGWNDTQGSKNCHHHGLTFFAVNPGNDNYSGSVGKDKAFDNNDVGYYLCIQPTVTIKEFSKSNPQAAEKLKNQSWFNDSNTQLNNKATICNNIAPAASPWLTTGPGYEKLVFHWQGFTPNDGICECGYPGGSRSPCGEQPPTPPKSIVDASLAAAHPEIPETVSAPVDANGVEERLNSCIQDQLAKARSCESEAEDAKNSCNSKNNSNVGNNSSIVKMASGATQIMGQVFNMQHQAQGVQAECFRAGAVANSASTAIKEMDMVCKEHLTSCNRICNGNNNDSKVEEFKRVCAEAAHKTQQQLEADTTSPNGKAYNDAAAQIQSIVEPALRVCTVEAQGNKDVLSKLADGIGQALQSSVKCACQTSSGGANCDKIPSVQDCSMIPQPAGCGAYSAMDTCSMGSGSYNAKTCGCMQNPAAPGCNGSSNAVSSFSGPGIAANMASAPTGGGVSFGGGPSGGGGGLGGGGGVRDPENNDLSFLNGKPSTGSGAPNGSAGGGGAAGVGAPPNGDSADKGLLPEEEKGIGGAFSAAKTFMANAFGLGKKAANSAPGNGSLQKPDMGKFKPLRGLAGRASGMGSKNMDIWKMMNSCTSGDTCKSNENNYLIAP